MTDLTDDLANALRTLASAEVQAIIGLVSIRPDLALDNLVRHQRARDRAWEVIARYDKTKRENPHD